MHLLHALLVCSGLVCAGAWEVRAGGREAMECVIGAGAVRCGGGGIGAAVALERRHRSGARESLFVKSRKAHSKQYGNGVSVSVYLPCTASKCSRGFSSWKP